ncbi:uncharacterized protein LODBEIA_P16050 [Lodderomyces beijingensis]|uniref:Uncharacterized protein n=1 Tax=Lodderomyces beijingensis TaxID=1775926 RepID=A0ABP0ZKH9_9ASCO
MPNKENNTRLTYLYQLSNMFTTSTTSTTRNSASILARGYDRNFDLIAKKTVSKISPNVKRTMCKRCHCLLVPGLTMSMRIENLSKTKDEKSDVLIYECLQCGQCKRFPVGRDREYVPFHERNTVVTTS